MQGRKITNEEWEEFLKILRENLGIISIACRKAGISRTSYYLKREDDLEFQKKADEIIDTFGIGLVEEKLMEAILKGNIAAIIFYLKCKSKKWRPWIKTEVSGELTLREPEKELADIINTLDNGLRTKIIELLKGEVQETNK